MGPCEGGCAAQAPTRNPAVSSCRPTDTRACARVMRKRTRACAHTHELARAHTHTHMHTRTHRCGRSPWPRPSTSPDAPSPTTAPSSSRARPGPLSRNASTGPARVPGRPESQMAGSVRTRLSGRGRAILDKVGEATAFLGLCACLPACVRVRVPCRGGGPGGADAVRVGGTWLGPALRSPA